MRDVDIPATAAEDSGSQKHDFTDMFYHTIELSELMGAITDLLREVDYVKADGTRNHELDRVAALQRIACALVTSLQDQTEIFDGPGSWRRA